MIEASSVMRSSGEPSYQAVLKYGLALLVLGLAPIVHNQIYFIHVLSLALIAAVATLGMQLLIGFSGQLSMGQAAFFGIGAYTSGILTKTLAMPFVAGFVGAGLVAGLSSLILVPITRLRGIYLAVATLGFTIIVHLVLLNEEWLTGGSFGILGIPRPSFGLFALHGEMGSYYLALVVLIVTYAGLHRLVHSRFGRGLQAIMLDEDAARASGINVTLYKSKCFVVSAIVTGFAGCLFAHHTRYLNPDDFTFWRSIEILIMAVLGGIGSLPGAVVGAFIVVLLPECLRAFDQWRLVVYGALLILFMGFGKGGVIGLVAQIWRTGSEMTLLPFRALLRKAEGQ
jgi:branched-chain amino acid transport system permease protein